MQSELREHTHAAAAESGAQTAAVHLYAQSATPLEAAPVWGPTASLPLLPRFRIGLERPCGTEHTNIELGGGFDMLNGWLARVLVFGFVFLAGCATTPSLNNLAVRYWNGEGVPKDRVRAVELYRQAIQRDSSRDAMFNLGLAYASGEGVVRDYSQAAVWFQRAADKGSSSAIYQLAESYRIGRGVPKDPAKAANLYKIVLDSEPGNDDARLRLSLMVLDKQVEGDGAQALTEVSRAAERGSQLAQVFLGNRYLIGDGVSKDPAKAVELFRRAGNAGSTAGLYYLALAYQKGTGVQKDDAEANALFERAANEGEIAAVDQLADSYRLGRGTPKDSAKAAALYRRVLEANPEHEAARINLATMVLNREVAGNVAGAIEQLNSAAEKGSIFAQVSLGLRYMQGDGVPQDPAKAAALYRVAAERGSSVAQFHLGLAYRSGKGVEQDDAEANEWFRRAADQGDLRRYIKLLIAIDWVEELTRTWQEPRRYTKRFSTPIQSIALPE